MLPASSSASPKAPAVRRQPSTDRLLTGLVIVSMLYTLLLGWGLLARFVPFQAAYLLMALPCLSPALWYAYGFLRVSEAEQDFGLLLSALGWGCIAIALLAKHSALNADLRARQLGTLIDNPGQSQTATVFLIIGLLMIISGAVLSAHAWIKSARRGDIE